MKINALKVSEINNYIKRLLSGDPILNHILVEGEISNFKHHYSGHMYFTLKDTQSKIKCVMFSGDNHKLKFKPEDGINVFVKGYVSVFERDGSYQLYVRTMEAKGLGDLYVAFEKLKKKLDNEGLFDTYKKKQLPLLPKKIGIVTSATGAAVKDIITVIKRRFQYVDILIYPVLVQGNKASVEISEGIKYFNTRQDIDLIITGRGGGSLEELWAFNEEEVARTIYKSELPVVSAVGHETDFTIADFAADLRAPTPSAAGELSVPVYSDLKNSCKESYIRLNRAIEKLLINQKRNLLVMKKTKLFVDPLVNINQDKQHLDYTLKDLVNAVEYTLNTYHNKLTKLGGQLDAMSPLSVLTRGYTIAQNEKGEILKSVKDIDVEKNLHLIFNDGQVLAKPIKIQRKKIREGDENE